MIIGITGGIASGKSLVSSKIKDLGFELHDCDLISHAIFETDTVQERLKDEFGFKGERVSRKDISSIVFSDEAKIKVLNNIIHPLILDELDRIIYNVSEDDVVFIDVPLLYELKLEYLFDKIIFVYVDEEKQIERLKDRDRISTSYAKEKIKKQIPMDIKKEHALKNKHFIIDNNSGLEELYRKLDFILKEINNDF